MPGEFDFDVIIIGGGPAGAAAAARMARYGRRVAVFEGQEFPRFRIGESLLPDGNRALKEIGVWEKVEAGGFVRKPGAEFFNQDGSRWVHNVFAHGLGAGREYAYQVDRSRFDTLLLEHAAECGARVFQPCPVRRVDMKGPGASVRTVGGETYTARFLLDASGRPGFLGVRDRLPKDPLPYPPKVAVYSHFEGVARFPGERSGNIVITRLHRGWCWMIPLDAKLTSVGVVGYTSDLKRHEGGYESWFRRAIADSAFLRGRMEGATPRMKLQVTTDYTYQYTAFGGRRFLLAGDAACFIDPIFSSGVYFAMESSLEAAAIMERHLSAGKTCLTSAAVNRYTRGLKARVRVMRRLIETFYSDRGYDVFMSPTNRFGLFAAVNSIVAGNTRMTPAVWIRYRLFLAIVRANEVFGMVSDARGDTKNTTPAEVVDGEAGPGECREAPSRAGKTAR